MTMISFVSIVVTLTVFWISDYFDLFEKFIPSTRQPWPTTKWVIERTKKNAVRLNDLFLSF